MVGMPNLSWHPGQATYQPHKEKGKRTQNRSPFKETVSREKRVTLDP